MAKQGPHPDKALSAAKVRSITLAGRYADGNGLYLVVDPSGAKRWLLRTVVRGKRRDIGLGGLKVVSLAEAREKALSYRKIARDGGDPLAERNRSRMVVPKFAEAARAVHKEHAQAWKNEKHGNQWINTLEQYVFPTIGEHRVDHVETADVLKVLGPIWLTKAETARRVRQRIRTVLDWATASGFRSGENPVDSVGKGLPRQPDNRGHHAALPHVEVPDFITNLRQAPELGEATKLAFEFLILTAGRTREVVEAEWREIDLERAIWTVPASRMKAGKEHRVPLSPRCVDILKRARKLSADGSHVFPGRSFDKPLSNMVFLMALRRTKLDITAHGFRSAFRDWAAERTNFPREVCEMALAHALKDKVEAAYRRGDLFEKRRELMDTWAAFVTSEGADVVTLRSA
ncbi:MAG: integrase arm-type DNA-binding domain-containing protein [Alphaproteobacteria bacterium]